MSELKVAPQVTVEILCGDPCGKSAPLNANIAAVLRAVDELGSLNAATKTLHMGYSNTLYAICDIEEALGSKVLERVCPKGSVLTDEGRSLLELFEKAQQETQVFANQLVSEAIVER